MRNETIFIQSELSAILKLGVHLPKMEVFLTETGSARTIYLSLSSFLVYIELPVSWIYDSKIRTDARDVAMAPRD